VVGVGDDVAGGALEVGAVVGPLSAVVDDATVVVVVGAVVEDVSAPVVGGVDVVSGAAFSGRVHAESVSTPTSTRREPRLDRDIDVTLPIVR
jgi:hypothetical protein